MKISRIMAFIPALISLSLPACNKSDAEPPHAEHQKILCTSPLVKDVVVTQQYVCQIRSQNFIEVCALVGGRLEEIPVREGQAVKRGEPMFKILPTLYQAKLDAELAEVRLAEIEFERTEILFNQTPPVVSKTEVLLYKAKLAKAQATANRTKAEVDFTVVRAPFDGIVDRLPKQLGSTIKEGEILTTLSDNSVMWVYYNVPEARYLEDMTGPAQSTDNRSIELELANGAKFPQSCVSHRIEAQFDNTTGNIKYRADFPNPDRLLRHGQTGNILVHRLLKNAIVIPQRATFEILDKRYVYVVDKDDVAHQREIVVLREKDDIFVIARKENFEEGHKKNEHKTDEHKKDESKKEEHKKEGPKKGIDVNERIVLEGVRQIHDGEKIEFDYVKPEVALAEQKQHAE